MKYMMLIHQGPEIGDFENLSDEEKAPIYAAWGAIRETPGVTPGMQLAPPDTATTVRGSGGETLVTDGPFAETKDAVGGYLIYEADDLDAALALAARIPAVQQGGGVEVRPIVEW